MNTIERAIETVIGLNKAEDPKALARRVMRVVRAGYSHGLSGGRPLIEGHGVRCRCGEWFNATNFDTANAALDAHQTSATFAAVD